MPSKYLQAFRTVGLSGIWRHMRIMKDVKIGNFVGRDRIGNEYYETDTNYDVSPDRSRYVIPFHKTRHIDTADISPEWHAWIHHSMDVPPTAHRDYAAAVENQTYSGGDVNLPSWVNTTPNPGNPTGLTSAYKPYSTVKHRIEAWQGTPQERRT